MSHKNKDEKEEAAKFEAAVQDDRYTYDMCMVFTIPDKKKEEAKDCWGKPIPHEDTVPAMTGPDIVEKLKKAGLQVRLYQSIGHDEVYCLIGASEKRLEMEADRIDLDLLFDKEKTLKIADEEYKIKLAQKTRNKDSTCILISDTIWDNIYGKFDPDPMKTRLYKTYNDDGPMHQNSFFRSTDRINLLVSIIEAPLSLKGAGLSITRLKALKNTHVKAFFPLHEPKKLEKLEEQWICLKGIWSPPLDMVRDYYGEKVALYFAFLNFYTKMLAIPSVFGVMWILIQRANTKYTYAPEQLVQSRVLWLFAIIMIVWSASFLEMWKRKEAFFRIQWGMGEFKQKEQTRPEFRGEWVINPIDGKLITYFPTWKKALLLLVSQSVVISLILCVIVSVAGVFIARLAINAAYENDATTAAVLGALINVVVIQFFNQVYGKVGKYLNDYENHRTDSDFENALIGKSFLFKFVNSYNSLFYIAFAKSIVEVNSKGGGCNTAGTNKRFPCMDLLSTQLLIVFGSMIVINNTMELGIPFIMGLIRSKAEQGNSADDKSFPELEYERQDYESTFDDFDELAIQFGYVLLFVVALPIAPLLAFLNNILEAFIDSSKLVRLDKRPEPRGCYNIGTWQSIFNVIAWIGIVTNIGLVCLYTNEVREWAGFAEETVNNRTDPSATAVTTLALIFFVAEHFVAGCKFAVEYLIPDEPEEVTAHIARQQYLVNLLIGGASEEEDDSELLLASDDPEFAKAAGTAGKQVVHVAEKFTLVDGAGGDHTTHDAVPAHCPLDAHCTFENFVPKNKRGANVQALATTPADVSGGV